jgi:hypothetical protein
MSASQISRMIAAMTLPLLVLSGTIANAESAAPAAQPPASLKCKVGRTPAQVTTQSGRLVWKCVKSAATPAATGTTTQTPTPAPTPEAAATPPAAPTVAPVVVQPVSAPAPAAPVTTNPVVVAVPAGSSPPVPAGLKVTCMDGANVFTSNGTCPVVKYKGLTTWAFSFVDNRMSFALVTYDANNNVVRNSTVDGSRYVWQITVDEASRSATVWGQATTKVTAAWAQFAGEPVPVNSAAAPAPAPTPATPVVQVIPTFGQAPTSTTTTPSVIAVQNDPCPVLSTQPQPTGSSSLSGLVNVTPAQPAACPN